MVQIPEVVLELISNGGFPAKHLSYSSLKEYLGNPRSFLKKYIRYEFDEKTKAVFMVGKSVHKALEEYFELYKEAGEMMDLERVQLIGLDFFRRELLITRARGLTKWIKGNGGSFDFPIFTKDISNDDIKSLYDTALTLAMTYVAIEPGVTPENEDEYRQSFLTSDVEYSLIETGAKSLEDVLQDSEDQIRQAISNFFDSDWIPEGKVHSTEKEETVFFTDENGLEMPVPVKAIIDRVDIVGDRSIVTDYKTSDKFTTADADKADYEMQAGTNYVTALVATGVHPKKMRFVEILKKAPGYILESDPDKRLLKDDLVDLVKTRLPEYTLTGKELVPALKTILIDSGILVKEKSVNVFEIDFDDRPDIMATFFSMYKGVVTMIALSEMFGIYLPNISAQWGGVEAWQDFKEFEGMPREKIQDSPQLPPEDTPIDAVKKDDLDDVDGF